MYAREFFQLVLFQGSPANRLPRNPHKIFLRQPFKINISIVNEYFKMNSSFRNKTSSLLKHSKNTPKQQNPTLIYMQFEAYSNTYFCEIVQQLNSQF